MSLSTTASRISYNGDGASVTFAFPYYFIAASDLKVLVGGVQMALTTDYTVSGAGVSTGGSITLNVAPAVGTNNIVIYRDPDQLQASQFPSNDPFPSKTTEAALDKLTMLVQRCRDLLNRSFTLPDSDASGASTTIPTPAPSKLIGWNSSGNALTNYDTTNASLGVAGQVFAATPKTTPANADLLPLVDSASGFGLKSLTWSNLVSAVVGFVQSGTGAVTRTVQDKELDSVSVNDFMTPSQIADVRAGTLLVDVTSAIQAALDTGKDIQCPDKYLVTGNLNFSVSGTRLRGAGSGKTTFVCNSASNPVFTASTGISGCSLEGFRVTRSIAATSGGHGISTLGSVVSRFRLKDIKADSHYNGLALGPTDWGWVEDVVSENNYNHGFYFTNTSTVGTLQWVLSNPLSQMNNGSGYYVEATAGGSVTSVSMGEWNGTTTFANTGYGVAFMGNASNSINGVRLNGGFLGNDGIADIYLDTHGYQHVFHNIFVEMAGTGGTGRGMSTPETGTGVGIKLTSANGPTTWTGVRSTDNKYSGFESTATGIATLTGCSFTNNGRASPVDPKNASGVYITGGGGCILNGSTVGVYGGNTTQQYGVYTYNGFYQSIISCDMTGNATSAWSATTNLNYIQSIGNLPNNLGVQLSAQGSVIVGGGVTGGFAAAGTINVAGGMYKNNTAYNNP